MTLREHFPAGATPRAGQVKLLDALDDALAAAEQDPAAPRILALEAPPGPGWIVTNPPYGVRVSEGRDLRNLYAQLGKTLRARCPGWHVALLAGDPRLARVSGLRFDERRSLRLVNGGLRVTLLQGEVVA